VTFPENYKSTFARHHTIDVPATRRLRYDDANPVALQAAR